VTIETLSRIIVLGVEFRFSVHRLEVGLPETSPAWNAAPIGKEKE
jgi:hypothetical protein